MPLSLIRAVQKPTPGSVQRALRTWGGKSRSGARCARLDTEWRDEASETQLRRWRVNLSPWFSVYKPRGQCLSQATSRKISRDPPHWLLIGFGIRLGLVAYQKQVRGGSLLILWLQKQTPCEGRSPRCDGAVRSVLAAPLRHRPAGSNLRSVVQGLSPDFFSFVLFFDQGNYAAN